MQIILELRWKHLIICACIKLYVLGFEFHSEPFWYIYKWCSIHSPDWAIEIAFVLCSTHTNTHICIVRWDRTLVFRFVDAIHGIRIWDGRTEQRVKRKKNKREKQKRGRRRKRENRTHLGVCVCVVVFETRFLLKLGLVKRPKTEARALFINISRTIRNASRLFFFYSHFICVCHSPSCCCHRRRHHWCSSHITSFWYTNVYVIIRWPV